MSSSYPGSLANVMSTSKMTKNKQAVYNQEWPRGAGGNDLPQVGRYSRGWARLSKDLGDLG